MLNLYKTLAPLAGLLILAGFSGCGDDAFSQISNIEIPPHEPLTVISAHFVAGDTILRAALNESREIVAESEEVSDGFINAYADDQLIANWTFRSDSSLFSGEFNLAAGLPATEGVRYRLEGRVDSLPIASAEQLMPAPPQLENVNYDSLGGLSLDGEAISEVRFSLAQPSSGIAYYAFRILEPSPFGSCREVTQDSIACTEIAFNPRFLETPDPLLVEGGNFMLMTKSDDIPAGNYEIILQFFENSGDPDYILEVLALTEDGYRYLRSFRAFEDARFDPFSEPVNVHDNVQDGYGYFMVSNPVRVVLRE